MSLTSIFLTIIFAAVLCVTQIPKMVREQLHRELAAFSVILFCGVLLVILKVMNVNIPNPADLIAEIYAPIVSAVKGALE